MGVIRRDSALINLICEINYKLTDIHAREKRVIHHTHLVLKPAVSEAGALQRQEGRGLGRSQQCQQQESRN